MRKTCTIKCKQCSYFKEHVFEGYGWCSQGMKSCEPDAPICNPTYAKKEYRVIDYKHR